MNRYMTQDMNQNMINDKEQRIERIGNRFMTSCFKVHALRYALVLLMIIGGANSVWADDVPFEVTTDNDETNHTEKFYWIESAGAAGFYVVPHSNIQNASTTNAPTLRALWYFKESDESGYYYIINKETSKYLKKTGKAGDDNTIQVADYAAADDVKFKFSFGTPDGVTEGYWVIYPKDNTSNNKTGWLSKKSGNLQYNLWLKSSIWGDTPVGDLNSQWKIVARNAVQWPKSGLPFVVSTSSEKHYYRINHAQSTDYNISYDGNNYVTISTELDNKTAWYFEEVATDPNIDNLKYYYIVNASGKYLKFTATTFDGKNQNDKFTLSDYNSQDADHFQFVVVNSYAAGNTGYSIMPKLAMSKYDVNNYANSMVPSSVANNEKLDLRSDRNNDNAHWNFVTTAYPMKCTISSILYDSSTGKITITSSPSYVNIHYTTDGETEPTSSVGTPYSGPFVVSSPITIKAIATADGYIDSDVVTKSFGQVAAPTIVNTEASVISITSATNGAKIYYTTDGSTPTTTSSTEYTGPVTITASSVTIKAIAVKDGMINSAVSTESFAFSCPTPTITFDNTTNTVTIASETGSTIYYAYGSTDPADPTVDNGVAHGSSPVTFTINAKTYIKAIAVKEGLGNSDMQSATIDKLAAPTISFTSDGKVKLISSTSAVTIYYEVGAEGNVPDPTTSSTRYTLPLSGVSGKVIKAIAVKKGWINSDVGGSEGVIELQCAQPVIRRGSGNTISITCDFPAEGVSIYYTTDGSTTPSYTLVSEGEPTIVGTLYDKDNPEVLANFPVIIKAIAVAEGYKNSSVSTETITADLVLDGGYYLIASAGDFEKFVTMANTAEGAGYNYRVTGDFTVSSSFNSEITQTFTGIFEGTPKDDGSFYTIERLRKPLFNTTSNAVIKNVMLKDVQISGSGAKGAIAGTANDYTRIYNCGILPSSNKFENETSDISSSDNHCGGLVGDLNDDSRVVNCFSYAKITGGIVKAGIVGYNETGSTAAESGGKYTNLKTMVVNCMFYGDITGNSGVYPVYGGSKILNTGANGINNYNFYRAKASLTPSDYNCSWPASEENLTRFEYYRHLLNSNRELCGWWVKSDMAPSTMDASDVQAIAKDASLMAKWVLDPALAPYPILKSFGKYPSVINLDPDQRTDPSTKKWINRTASANTIQTNDAPDTEGETLGTVSVTINAGTGYAGSGTGSDSRSINITAMDNDNNDFCYGKIQLPYYNEIFGDQDGDTWDKKYGGNYKSKVVTGWDITTSEGTTGTFSDDPITGYNFADRNCTDKDEHRVFAQGGFYYVPYGVTSITITAHWANAYYLSNTGGYYEREYFSGGNNNIPSAGQPFTPAGTHSFGSSEFGGQTIKNGTIADILADNNTAKESSVYDCAIVLVSNYQYRNNTNNIADNNRKPFTLMTVDLDFDNEPDYCFEWQFGGGEAGVTRAWINPVRFDFLPIVELGIAMKEDNSKYLFAIGKLTPYGHFEITETALIHMGQFEYDDQKRDVTGPVILNNGTFDQICRGSESDADQNVNYFILGGHVKMPSFTPGSHVRKAVKSRHCAVNVLGGEITYFYLSGNYIATPTNEGNPHCYIDGGKLDFVASGAKEQIVGNVFWEIDHAYIGEFYGGGINADKAVAGNIDITINRSKVWKKFCGGPQFGNMNTGKTVTTRATGTTFEVFYGAGNGGTCYSQYDQSDVTTGSSNNYTPATYNWEVGGGGKLANYTALNYRSNANPKGYHAKYELEMINSSAGTMNNAVCRTYMYVAEFATTNTGPVNSMLTDCKVETDFFGGGLLGGVNGNVTSKLTGHTVVYGSVYGGGYGVADLTVDILPKGTGTDAYTAPTRDENTAVITDPGYPDPTTYYWIHDTTMNTGNNKIKTVDGKTYLYTTQSLDNLGTVNGSVFLTIEGTTEIHEDVFGGGDKGEVTGSTTVTIRDTPPPGDNTGNGGQ